MEVWTTFTPSKVCWELTNIATKGKAASSNWQENLGLIESSLKKLKKVGISGTRLVIFPSEITNDGKVFNWVPINKVLRLSAKHELKVDLCIGPFQYPNYPGIYLASGVTRYVFDNRNCLDTIPELWTYGIEFIKAQIKHFGTDKRINGFHLGNEWPDKQIVSDTANIKKCISSAFMLEAAKYLKKNTNKPISLNTNIDVSEKKNLKKTFWELLEILGNRGRLGFDIYPSQETWKKVPLLKVKRMIWSYSHSMKSIQKIFPATKLFFAEVEAQPWGGGQSWYQIINEAEVSSEIVLKHSINSLNNTWDKYIKDTNCQIVSLWGSDFWLSANMMSVKWPFENLKKLTKTNT